MTCGLPSLDRLAFASRVQSWWFTGSLEAWGVRFDARRKGRHHIHCFFTYNAWQGATWKQQRLQRSMLLMRSGQFMQLWRTIRVPNPVWAAEGTASLTLLRHERPCHLHGYDEWTARRRRNPSLHASSNCVVCDGLEVSTTRCQFCAHSDERRTSVVMR